MAKKATAAKKPPAKRAPRKAAAPKVEEIIADDPDGLPTGHTADESATGATQRTGDHVLDDLNYNG